MVAAFLIPCLLTAVSVAIHIAMCFYCYKKEGTDLKQDLVAIRIRFLTMKKILEEMAVELHMMLLTTKLD